VRLVLRIINFKLRKLENCVNTLDVVSHNKAKKVKKLKIVNNMMMANSR